MKTWFEAEIHRIPPRGALAEAIRYALTRWTALFCFLDDGRIELDNNTVERAIRPIALGGMRAFTDFPIYAGAFKALRDGRSSGPSRPHDTTRAMSICGNFA